MDREGELFEDEIQIDLSDIYQLEEDKILQDSFNVEDDLFSESLKKQVTEELMETSMEIKEEHQNHKHLKRKKILIITASVVGVLLLLLICLFATRPGRKILYRMAGGYLHGATDYEDGISDTINFNGNNVVREENEGDSLLAPETNDKGVHNYQPDPRSEKYVSNYLIFGLEEIDSAKNTDTIMLVSINSQDKTIKLTSLLRDIYVATESIKPGKLNSIFASKGATGLASFVEKQFLIKIDGYAYINFSDFETMVNYLGGITISLGEEEANYLNKTNYISMKQYRNVTPGSNRLNGNQVLGYCRIRKVSTLGGATDDYGRTLRQRRVIEALFNSYKSKNIFDLISIANQCLSHVKTNLTAVQLEKALELVIENQITTMETMRLPVNGTYESLSKYNGVDDPLVIDYQANIVELYQFIFLDSEEKAKRDVESRMTGVIN